jgi:hypothetical protein
MRIFLNKHCSFYGAHAYVYILCWNTLADVSFPAEPSFCNYSVVVLKSSE